MWRILAHAGLRVASLVLLGVVFVNLSSFNPEATGMRETLWTLLFFLGVIVVWSAPLGEGRTRQAHIALKILAALGMAWLLVIFRRSIEGGGVSWFRPEWWGILGLIGWAYLGAVVIYLLTRGNPTALMGLLALSIAVYVGQRHGSFPGYLDPFGEWVSIGLLFGTDTTIVLAGVLVGRLLTKDAAGSRYGKALFMLLFGLGLYAAGMLIRPLHGICKNAGTDAFALVTAGECCLLFLAFFWAIEMHGMARLFAWLIPIGGNALLVYILPDVFGSFLDLTRLNQVFWRVSEDWAGIGNAAAVTAVILALGTALTAARVRLKL